MIVITGATGHLGRLVIDAVLQRGVPAQQVVAAVREPQKASALAALGLQIREADYDRPDTLTRAFDGADKVLQISGSEVGRRVPQHKAVVDAAKTAGVRLLAYTSVLHADSTTLVIAPEHQATEEYIRSCGLAFSLLRNGWYTENYGQAVRQALASGTIIGAAGEGRIASASRVDYAAAAAAVLTTEGHEKTIYELSGDTAWTMSELAAAVTDISGVQVGYKDLNPDEYIQAITGAGVPEPVARTLAQIEADIANGLLSDTPGDLSRLIGRPTTPLRDTITGLVKVADGPANQPA
ncbi:SDR family oxidoreductase [Saccharopolyspora pogona]|uniref:SDR family oxidoreductase n=1 Tax=Saccharopolyspora pogona TaxID=333966 RepID=UPI001685D29D|nr:SDR family oxidoreductase [Saccharopolyspora pogona]